MPRRIALGTILQRAKRRADMENDGSITDAEWYALISEAYGELYTIVFESGLEYFETSTQYTTTGVNTLAEVSNHLSTVALAYLVDASTGRYRALRELMAQERTMMSGLTSGSYASCFSLVDDTIYLYPTPPSGQVYELRYVPQSPDLTLYEPDALVDVVVPDGEAFMLWSVAVKALSKSESDVQLHMAEREAARERLTKTVGLRALNAPRRRVLDTEITDGEAWIWDRYGW